MKQAFLLISILSLFSIFSFSETIKTRCFIKDKIDGNNIIELNPNVIIYASDPVNGWCKTKLFIIIDKAFVEKAEYILSGATIKDYYRKSPIIGTIIRNLSPSEIFSREDGNFEALIDGFISYESIDIKTIPERTLENILSSNISSLDPKLFAFIKELILQREMILLVIDIGRFLT